MSRHRRFTRKVRDTRIRHKDTRHSKDNEETMLGCERKSIKVVFHQQISRPPITRRVVTEMRDPHLPTESWSLRFPRSSQGLFVPWSEQTGRPVPHSGVGNETKRPWVPWYSRVGSLHVDESNRFRDYRTLRYMTKSNTDLPTQTTSFVSMTKRLCILWQSRIHVPILWWDLPLPWQRVLRSMTKLNPWPTSPSPLCWRDRQVSHEQQQQQQ